ncbi:MAG TPA: PaaI family thioesterase [Aquihabitans sp.]|jgi:acyl-coenzyme A thioesterase PaaI-like protein|nr:PaaI family thioesterase [Aquihabitans sp.]
MTDADDGSAPPPSTDPLDSARWTTDYVPRMAGQTDPDRLNLVTQRIRAASQGELSPRRAALKDLADASRLLIDRLVATDAPDDVILAATAEIAAAAERFAGHHQGTLYGFSEAANAGKRADPLYDHSPLIGIANPLAPPMSMLEVDGVIEARVRFGQAYEGPPGCVHGGYVAAAFDELLGATQSLSGAPGMTGTLTVRYERPTPLKRELRLEGRLVGVERRKIFVEGACYAGDDLTATAKGIFISMRPGQFLDVLAEREARQEEQR